MPSENNEEKIQSILAKNFDLKNKLEENSESYRIKPCSVVIISPGVYNRGIALPENRSVLIRVDARRISMFVVIFFVCLCVNQIFQLKQYRNEGNFLLIFFKSPVVGFHFKFLLLQEVLNDVIHIQYRYKKKWIDDILRLCLIVCLFTVSPCNT